MAILIYMTKKSHAHNIFWILLSVVFGKIFPLVSGVVLIKIFDTASYGEYTAVMATVNLVLAVTCVGMSGGFIASLVSDAELNHQTIIGNYIITNLLLSSVIIFSSSALIAFDADHSPILKVLAKYLVLIILIIYVQIFTNVQNLIAVANNQTKLLMPFALVSGISISLGQVGLGYYFGVDGVLFAILAGSQLQYFLQKRLGSNYGGWFILIFNSTKDIKKIYSNVKNTMVSYGGLLFLSSCLVACGMWLLMYKILNSESGAEQVAYWGIFNHWKMIIMFAPIALGGYISSVVGRSVNKNGLIDRVLLVTAVYMGFLCILLVLYPGVVYKVYGEKIKSIHDGFVIVAIISFMSSINSVFGNYMNGLKDYWRGFVANLIWFAVILVCLVIFSTKEFDAIKALYVLFFAYFLHTIYQLSVYLSYRFK